MLLALLADGYLLYLYFTKRSAIVIGRTQADAAPAVLSQMKALSKAENNWNRKE